MITKLSKQCDVFPCNSSSVKIQQLNLTKRKRKLLHSQCYNICVTELQLTSGYATWFTAGGCNLHRSLWRHWWRHNSETIGDREKRRSPHPMKSSELSNGENHIALWQLLQNRKLRHLWRHNFGSRWKLQKMARENFSIGAFYNITKNYDNPMKTVGRDSFLSPKTPKNTSFSGSPSPQGSHSPYILGDTTRPRHITYVLVWSKSDQRRLRKTMHKQTNRQTNKHYKNNGHLAVNQSFLIIKYELSLWIHEEFMR